MKKNKQMNYRLVSHNWKFLVLLLLLAFFQATGVKAQISVPAVFSDNMVLQRDFSIPVWGKANPTTIISVELGANKVRTQADEKGNWQLHLPQMKAGGPYHLSIYQGNSRKPQIVFKNVLIGDVWLASGQSNMEWEVQQSMNAEKEIALAQFPEIRFFSVSHDMSPSVREDIADGSWKVCDTNSVKRASAVAYFFAKYLHKEIHVPIGIIQSTWGGTPVEAWTSREQLLSSDLTRKRVFATDSLGQEHFYRDSMNLVKFWDIVYNASEACEQTIPELNFDDSDWKTIQMPGFLKHLSEPYYEGIVWLRKSIVLPETMSDSNLMIDLGQPELNYTLYVNGEIICKTVWNAEPSHQYQIPVSALRKGENLIVVRMAVLWGGGGFNPPASKMRITDGQNSISLAGEWRYREDLEPAIPTLRNFHRYPSFIYNAMIHPLIPYGIKGFIWYQGEDNAPDAYNYRHHFSMMINDWRIRWQKGYLPFLYVQLANFMQVQAQPTESSWAMLRESQSKALLLPNTGMACAIDLGEADDIHPKNKQDVGKRLALLALKQVYGQDVLAMGPVFQDFEICEDKIIIRFETFGSLLATDENISLEGFAIAGEDKKFVWATATINGNTVEVSSELVKKPVAVRYAWADNPKCNLRNSDGLPAYPFRTDAW